MSDSTTQPRPAQILIVEDEQDIAALVSYHLTREGYRVRTAASGAEALEAVTLERPDLVILDIMLPGLSGHDFLSELRRRPEIADVPVIVLTARREEADRVKGLQLGADDYITKPFSPRELVLRIAAVLRRAQSPPVESGTRLLRGGPISLDLNAMRVHVRGDEVTLTPTEYRLLLVLLERRGRVQSRRQLLESAWDIRAAIETRTVDMHVKRLRGKLGPAGSWIETVRGFGYRFRPDPERA